ncbi:hypothetical protein HFC70_13630 [Agrobacterium sp. a22-2]|uniref:GAD-like domain-containing protein n=1 Tax=Agrobacterium sp. a22-2 TaxID=2283840 RepID=UPI001447AE2E|nr:GAD-like domain-containing protein [Agrobacterium sp. a22-2]NKN37393.1 hypothetical protein [Agrobacterium sp. a22-2]
MSSAEFLEARGKPRNARPVSEAEMQAAEGRLPGDVLDFWRANGIGHYANKNYWLCTPALFDGLFRDSLAHVPGLRPEDLAAFGYSSLGTIDLWHREGRHFAFSLDVALLMDLTSRTRTEAPPHDLDELYRSAGMDVPENAVEMFLESRSRPEDIWMILLNATSADTYRMIFDDNGRALTPQLRRNLGELSEDEVYFRNKDAIANLVDHYEKLTIDAASARVPREIFYSFATEVSGAQHIVEQTIVVGGTQ